jgi:single-stranded DNA-binding protein
MKSGQNLKKLEAVDAADERNSMIDGLIMGRVSAKAEKRTSKAGKPFATIRVRASGGDKETVFINVICFEEQAMNALLALDADDSVAIAGELTPRAWVNKEGNARPALDLLAHRICTAYHVSRKRAQSRSDTPDVGNAPPQFEDEGQW